MAVVSSNEAELQPVEGEHPHSDNLLHFIPNWTRVTEQDSASHQMPAAPADGKNRPLGDSQPSHNKSNQYHVVDQDLTSEQLPAEPVEGANQQSADGKHSSADVFCIRGSSLTRSAI